MGGSLDVAADLFLVVQLWRLASGEPTAMVNRRGALAPQNDQVPELIKGRSLN